MAEKELSVQESHSITVANVHHERKNAAKNKVSKVAPK
jgi:hypothetical protein